MSAADSQLKNSESIPSIPSASPRDTLKSYGRVSQLSPSVTGGSSSNNNGDSKERKSKLYGFSAKDVAEEMTLMDAGLLRLIKANELEDGAWMKKDKDQRAPNIVAMVKAFNKVALLVPTEILDETTPQARAKVLSMYIKVAQECYCLGNYNSLKAVLAGLQCTPVFRLARTWKEVSSRKKRKFEELARVMREDCNWAAYRKEISKKLQRNEHFVPFLGIFLTTTAFTQTLPTSRSVRGGISPSRAKMDVDGRRLSTESVYETYHLLEAITVREKLDKLRRTSITLSPGQMSESPINRDSEVITCGSCDDLDSPAPPTAGSSKEDRPSIASISAIQIILPDDDLSPTHFSLRSRSTHSGSEGSVRKIMGVARRSRLPSFSANTSPVRGARRNLEKCFEDETDSCPTTDGEMADNDEKASPNWQRGKRVRVSKGISKTAKFFSMLKSRYRNGMSTTVPTGLGDVVMDKDSNLVLCNDHNGFSPPQQPRQDREAVSELGGRRTSGCGLLRSKSQREPVHVDSGTRNRGHVLSMRELGDGERSQHQVLSGSLEGLLSAVNGRLSGEWSGLENFDSDEGEREALAFQVVKSARSPSMVTLASFDVADSNVEAIDGNSVSLSSSLSSPALKSLMDAFQNDSSPSDGLDSTSLTVALPVVGVDDSLQSADKVKKRVEEKKSKPNGEESLSRSPSSSSMDSAGSSCQCQTYLPTIRLHRRNSSDPNYLATTTVIKTKSPARMVSLDPKYTTTMTTPTLPIPTATTGVGGKRSSPLIRSITRASPEIRPTNIRRGGNHTSSIISQTLMAEGEESLSPIDLLHQYQFLSLGCCYLIQSRPEIRWLLTSDGHNSEALNYKLSYIREPD